MGLLRRLLLLYLAFTVDVRLVFASDTRHKAMPAEMAWISEPAKCQPGAKGCAVSAKVSKLALDWQGQAFVLTKGTAVWWPDQNTVRLIKGTMSLRLSEKLAVTVASGQLRGEGLVLLSRQESATRITVVDGEIRLRPLGSSEELSLPQGYSVWLGEVGGNGLAQVEVPQAADPAGTLKQWWSVYPGSKKQFMNEARDFVAGAAARAELVSQWHQQIVQRAVASQREQERRKQEARTIELREQAKMRALFRKMNNLSEEDP